MFDKRCRLSIRYSVYDSYIDIVIVIKKISNSNIYLLKFIYVIGCEISFYSWAHTIKQMKVQLYGNKNVTNTTHLSSNSEWLVYNTTAYSKIIETSEELLWWVNTYVLRIKRHTTYHVNYE